MDGVRTSEAILILTAANILEGLTSWFTGGSSMTKFGKELAEFGPYRNYYESIKVLMVPLLNRLLMLLNLLQNLQKKCNWWCVAGLPERIAFLHLQKNSWSLARS